MAGRFCHTNNSGPCATKHAAYALHVPPAHNAGQLYGATTNESLRLPLLLLLLRPRLPCLCFHACHGAEHLPAPLSIHQPHSAICSVRRHTREQVRGEGAQPTVRLSLEAHTSSMAISERMCSEYHPTSTHIRAVQRMHHNGRVASHR